MSNAASSDEILSIIKNVAPRTVGDLVEALGKMPGRDAREDLATITRMVHSGLLPLVKTPVVVPARLDPRKWPVVGALLAHARETPVRVMLFIITTILVSWVVLPMQPVSPVVATMKAGVLAVAVMFLPGFALVSAWYPYHSTVFDVRSIKAGKFPSTAERARPRPFIDVFTRVAYSICYSIAIVVMMAFLLALFNVGFDGAVMLGILTAIEITGIMLMVKDMRRSIDPYRWI